MIEAMILSKRMFCFASPSALRDKDPHSPGTQCKRRLWLWCCPSCFAVGLQAPDEVDTGPGTKRARVRYFTEVRRQTCPFTVLRSGVRHGLHVNSFESFTTLSFG